MVPALAASSPYVDGGVAGERDHRLAVYATHAARVPEMLGAIVPEPSTTRARYERDILSPMYDAIAPLDPAACSGTSGSTRAAPSRASTATPSRFVSPTRRNVPRADIAVAHAICALVKMLYDTHDVPDVPTGALAALLHRSIRDGEDAIAGEDYLRALGVRGGACPMRDAWRRALDRAGTRRIVARYGGSHPRARHARDPDPPGGRYRPFPECPSRGVRQACGMPRRGSPVRLTTALPSRAPSAFDAARRAFPQG
jgi:hypothetical protein